MNNVVLISNYSFFILLWITFAEYPGIDTTEKWKIILTCNNWRKKGHPRDSKIVFFPFLWWKDEVNEKYEELSCNHGLPSEIRQKNLPCKEISSVQVNNKTEIH